MRFMVIRKADPQTEAGMMPTRELIDAMTAYNEEMVRAGVMLAGDGLRPSRDGARVKFRGGKPTIVDGPFAEAKELVAGYSIWEVSSMDEAVEWARRSPVEGVVELRKILDAEDFGVFAAEITAAEERSRAEQAAG